MGYSEDWFSRLELVKKNVIEIVTEEDLAQILKMERTPRCYAGYEPSDKIHIGWLVWMLKLRDLQEAGFEVVVLEATWHAWINDKGEISELENYTYKVRKILSKIGVNAKYVTGDSVLSSPEYVKLLLKVSKHVSLDRVKRAVVVMRRRADEVEQDFSKVLYPVMQAVDALYLGVDVAVGGVDQKPAFMIARDVAARLGLKQIVILGLPVIPGLRAVSDETDVGRDLSELYAHVKMSSSRPDDAIFLEDTPDDIERKIRSAVCPPRDTRFNPVLAILKYVVLPYFRKIEVNTCQGLVSVTSPEELDKLYSSGVLTPEQLKQTCLDYVLKIVDQLRVC